MNTLKGKVMLITGGSRGIGAAIAAEAEKEGARVVVNYKKNRGGRKNAIRADVGDEQSVKKMIERIVREYGRIDILVNNAGVAKEHLLLKSTVEEFDAMVRTNCRGVYLCSKYAAEHMKKQRYGRIITMSSIVALTGAWGLSIYGGTKGFVIGFTKTLAKELGKYGVTANIVAPGYFDTDMTRDMRDDEKKEIIAGNPLGRFGKPEEVASAVLFLASDEARYINGAVLSVDGGQIL